VPTTGQAANHPGFIFARSTPLTPLSPQSNQLERK
jgi:hypothetical protein